MNSYLPQHQSASIYDDRREFLLASVSSGNDPTFQQPGHQYLFVYTCACMHMHAIC